jgi:hypothetical protein
LVRVAMGSLGENKQVNTRWAQLISYIQQTCCAMVLGYYYLHRVLRFSTQYSFTNDLYSVFTHVTDAV